MADRQTLFTPFRLGVGEMDVFDTRNEVALQLWSRLDRETLPAVIERVNGWDALVAERDEMRDKCAGCMTPDEKDETIAELAAERDATRKILDSILAADSAYRKALDDDYGGEQLAEAFGNVWDALKEAQVARAALSARSQGEVR